MEPMNIHQEISSENKPKGFVYWAFKLIWLAPVLFLGNAAYGGLFGGIVDILQHIVIFGDEPEKTKFLVISIGILILFLLLLFLELQFSRKLILNQKYVKAFFVSIFGVLLVLIFNFLVHSFITPLCIGGPCQSDVVEPCVVDVDDNPYNGCQF